MRTRSEKLMDKVGQKIECDSCHKKKTFTSSWRMTDGAMIICPGCQEKPNFKNKVMVNI